MQVLDWSMRHSVDLGLRRRDVRDDDETGEEVAEGDSDEESNGETTQVGAEVEEGHQDLISGMAVNEAGTLLVSCSIDGTVRVWDVLVAEFGGLLLPGSCNLKGKGKGADAAAAVVDIGFLEKVEKYGCPVQARRVLSGHVGWVNSKSSFLFPV
jgi:WD40 repeat protein